MAQKINPLFFRLGKFNNTWQTKAFFKKDKDYSKFVVQDILCRKMIAKDYSKAEISKVLISHTNIGDINVNIVVGRTSQIIGKQGELIVILKRKICKIFEIKEANLILNVSEEKHPDLSANILATKAAKQIEDRAAFKRVMKNILDLAMRAGAKGVKVKMSGRLGGAEIARSVETTRGSIPLLTLRAKIDYAVAEAITVYGVIGIKVTLLMKDFPVTSSKPSKSAS